MKEHVTNNKTYPITKEIQDMLVKHMHNIQEILKNDPESRDYLLQELLDTSNNTFDTLDKHLNWAHDKYDATLSITDYNNLLSAITHIYGLLNDHHPLVSNAKNIQLCANDNYQEASSGLQEQIINYYIEITNITDDISLAGNTTLEFI